MAKCKRTCNGKRNRVIEIVRRTIVAQQNDSADPTISYAKVFSVRAAIATHSGTNEWSKVLVGDRQATHTFKIAHTAVDFDARDRVRDGSGTLYEILDVEDKNQQGRELWIRATRTGDKTEPVAT